MHRKVGRDELVRSRDAPSPFKEVREVGSVGPAGVVGEAVAEIAGDRIRGGFIAADCIEV